MVLTPKDVANKRFTTVRLREGYDEDEVDAFLDEVESELSRLLRENDDLRGAGTPDDSAASASSAAATSVTKVLAPSRGSASTAAAPPALPAAGESAARILALAQQTADTAVAEASAEAERLLAQAQARAGELDQQTRTRSEALERDLDDRTRQAIDKLGRDQAQLQQRIDELSAFEREYRTRLRSYLQGQIRQLDGAGEDGLAPERPAGVPGLTAASTQPPVAPGSQAGGDEG